VAHSWKSLKLVSMLLIATTDHGSTELSNQCSLGNIFPVQKAAIQLYRKNVPLLHMSAQRARYVTACVYKAYPALVLQATNDAGVRRPGYEALLPFSNSLL